MECNSCDGEIAPGDPHLKIETRPVNGLETETVSKREVICAACTRMHQQISGVEEPVDPDACASREETGTSD